METSASRAASGTGLVLAPVQGRLQQAHAVLWRKGLEGSKGKRSLAGNPADILVQELKCTKEEADEIVERLSVADKLRFRGEKWSVLGGEDDDRESSTEFLSLRDKYALRDIADDPVQEFVGVSEAAEAVRSRITLAAEDDDIVLITGESGVGKGIAARLIHALSARSKGPFVHRNCAALPESVLESELFGHERGAFTSALALHRGCFESAEGGTLFLDEIGEVSMDFQKKLLQVLEEGVFFRVGGEHEVRSKARIVLATNQNLGQAVLKKAFRRDLFFRIYGIPIPISPIRDRPDDVPHLIAHYAAEFERKMPGKPFRISEEAFRMLSHSKHPWPGNVRELQAVMRMAQRLAKFGLIEPAHIEFPSLELLHEP